VHHKSVEKIAGHIEIDETHIGAKARNMHKDKKARVITGTGGMGKVAVIGLLGREAIHRSRCVRLGQSPHL
jgi:hypothetical protein